MKKLILKNPILRFKEGNKTKIDNHYISTLGDKDLYLQSATAAGVADRNSVAKLQRQWGIKDDGIWGKNTLAAWEAHQSKKPIMELGYKEPGALGSTFISSGVTTTSPEEAISYLKTPTSPVNTGFDNMSTFNINNIRNYRNAPREFGNVLLYWNWINDTRNQNDNLYKLWLNILQSIDGEEAKKQAFEEIMNQAGIRGNFGRRDSRRIADLLNTFRLIGTNGSDERNAFMKAYEPAFMNGYNEQQQTYNNYTLQQSLLNLRNNKFYLKKGGQLISNSPILRFKNGNKLLFALNGMTFKLAFDKARAQGNRYFFYDDGTGVKTYNTMKKGEDNASWAKKFKDNLTSGGADNVLTSINRGWSGKGASHGRYNSKGEYIKFNKASDAGPLAVKGDNINNNGDRGWGYADMPNEAINLGRGTNRGQHTGNIKTNVEIGDFELTSYKSLPEVVITGKRKTPIYYNIPMGAIEYTGRDGKRYWMRQKDGSNLYVYISRDKPISYAVNPVPEGYIIPGLNTPISKNINIGKIALNLLKKYF